MGSSGRLVLSSFCSRRPLPHAHSTSPSFSHLRPGDILSISGAQTRMNTTPRYPPGLGRGQGSAAPVKPPAPTAPMSSSEAAAHKKRNRIRFSCTTCREKKCVLARSAAPNRPQPP